MDKENKYSGPDHCDLCEGLLDEYWIDGQTIMGTWANMCPDCHDNLGTKIYTTFRHVENGLYEKIKSPSK